MFVILMKYLMLSTVALMTIAWKVVGLELLRLQLLLTYSLQQATSNKLSLLDDCVCPGHDIHYECTVCGRGATVWTGNLFDCAGDDIIILRHSEFERGFIGDCNNGALIARSIGIITKNCTPCFTSQLSFSANIVMEKNSTVECLYNNGTIETIVDTATVTITREPVPPPSHIHLFDVAQTHLTFNWNQSPSHWPWADSGSCSSPVYNIIASNCGTCPNSTTSEFATCTNMTINSEVCSFAVETEVCGYIIGQQNNSITVYLGVPDAPKVEANQLFSSASLSVIYSMINIMNPITISDGVDGSASSYTITYYSLISGNICSTATIPVPSVLCVDGACRHIFDRSSSVCVSDTHFVITAFASNVFGDGPTSNPVYINVTDIQLLYIYNCNVNYSDTDSLNHSSFGVLLATAAGSVAFLILIISSILFITAISIMAKYRAKITRDLNQEQEATNRADYEEVQINQLSEPSVMDNVAYEYISPINCD